MADLRYRNARDEADRLGQVFTPHSIATLLSKSIDIDSARATHVLDLGAGHGVLADAVLGRNKRATATLVEIDAKHVRTLRNSSSKRVSVVHADALGGEWCCSRHPGVIVSNPPYGMLQSSPHLREMIEGSGLVIPFNGDWVRGDAAFAARAWGIAGLGTKLGLIIASPIIRNSNYGAMRERLVHEIRGLCVTQLNEATFQKAEVSAFLLTGERAIRRKRNVLLRKAAIDGSVVDEIEVSHRDAVFSLDIDYHLALRRIGLGAELVSGTLGSVGTIITRGSRSQREYQLLGLDAFHTSDFPETAEEVTLPGRTHPGFHMAKAGDILIPRVGSRCLIRQARIGEGFGLFTDCVYRLVSSRQARARVWKTLNSSLGSEWRTAHAGGSCAKHLSIQALLRMPILSN